MIAIFEAIMIDLGETRWVRGNLRVAGCASVAPKCGVRRACGRLLGILAHTQAFTL